MYLHVGNQMNIRVRDIIGIFDTDRTTISHITRKYLSDAQRRDAVVSAADEIPKSFVLYRDASDGKIKICFSQLSTASLVGRVKVGRDGEIENI